jgi:hypothetical protein
MYGFPQFIEWMEKDLPTLTTGRLQAAEPPNEQVYFALHRWISGGEIRYNKMFNDLMPKRDEVWEMKTADIRIFGWMYKPAVFIAAFGDYADLYKGPRKTASYDSAVRKVKTYRDNIDLNSPKFATGNFDELVCV